MVAFAAIGLSVALALLFVVLISAWAVTPFARARWAQRKAMVDQLGPITRGSRIEQGRFVALGFALLFGFLAVITIAGYLIADLLGLP